MITAGTTFGSDVDDTDSLVDDPLALMVRWLPTPDSELRPLAALSTIGLDGLPSVRHVLVSERDAAGLTFHTDSASTKVAELAANPVAAVAVAWPEIGRQLVVRGVVQRVNADEAARVYAERSRYLQLLAWMNTRENAQLPAAARQRLWADFDDTHPELTPPARWVGFRLRPVTLTFWRGDPIGQSTRQHYTLVDGRWAGEILAG
ncbi:pyridoxamine 5'-phosphate oxidase family protein [Microbacterium trichothecenolyticum]|uniref:Pyridoxamine 5'-phosphate oxidase n=1 Tax=Microbacterium trichothecenolyticum TaxID=69370 RepID=A0ABU0TXS6_MICTR|nr:pyridoxamine 5'-phosphate oxidase family protein [Microbacterium trichothecenolyticum]MDQ1123767.1 pyridoxamine 5'-phosphate oxidase [Microbacterium trichothecenolyticum]